MASMETLTEIQSTEDLEVAVKKDFPNLIGKPRVEPYYMQKDDRCGWDNTYIVTDFQGNILGYCNFSQSQLTR